MEPITYSSIWVCSFKTRSINRTPLLSGQNSTVVQFHIDLQLYAKRGLSPTLPAFIAKRELLLLRVITLTTYLKKLLKSEDSLYSYITTYFLNMYFNMENLFEKLPTTVIFFFFGLIFAKKC